MSVVSPLGLSKNASLFGAGRFPGEAANLLVRGPGNQPLPVRPSPDHHAASSRPTTSIRPPDNVGPQLAPRVGLRQRLNGLRRKMSQLQERLGERIENGLIANARGQTGHHSRVGRKLKEELHTLSSRWATLSEHLPQLGAGTVVCEAVAACPVIPGVASLGANLGMVRCGTETGRESSTYGGIFLQSLGPNAYLWPREAKKITSSFSLGPVSYGQATNQLTSRLGFSIPGFFSFHLHRDGVAVQLTFPVGPWFRIGGKVGFFHPRLKTFLAPVWERVDRASKKLEPLQKKLQARFEQVRERIGARHRRLPGRHDRSVPTMVQPASV